MMIGSDDEMKKIDLLQYLMDEERDDWMNG